MVPVQNLPAYRRPPVVETILGVQFDSLRAFRTVHLGAFWKSLGSDWRYTNDAPAVEAQFERFGDGHSWGFQGLQFRLQQTMDIRIQMRNETGDRMIQLQNGRLMYNWQGHDGGMYPRYHAVRKEFDEIFEQFLCFVRAESLGELRPNQWEVTYVNQIPRDTVWNSPEDWSKLFKSPMLTPAPVDLVRLESFGGEWHFEIPPRRGRLHIRIHHGRGGVQPQEMLTVTLTARGPLKSEKGEDVSLSDGLDCGRETIVRTFTQITSDDAQRIWERLDENV